MENIVNFNSEIPPNSIKSGGFNIGVNGTTTDLSDFYTGICPINGGYTIYIDKAENGPSIYTPNNDTELVNITNLLGGSVSSVVEALTWINSQSNMTVVNSNYPSIVTDGLVVNLDAGFVSSYPKDGTTWKDLSGNGNNGTLVNGPIFDTVDESILFDGNDDYCDVPIPNIQSYTTITICGFMKWMSYGSDMFFGMTTYDVWTQGNCLGYNNFASNVIGIDAATVTSLGLLGNWKHYTFVMNKTGLLSTNKIYIDGISMGNLTAVVGTDRTIPGFNTNLRLASVNNGGYNCNIKYGNVMVYNRELTQSEITQNYYAGLQKFIPTDGLVLSLDAQNTNLYATSPTTAYDISGNGNNGVLLNGIQQSGQAEETWVFDGVDDYINCGNSSTFNVNQFSAGFWVNLSISAIKEIFLKNNNTNNGIGPIEIYQNGRRISHRVNGNLVAGTTELVLNKWYLITLTYNQVNKILYINETQETSHPYSTSLNVSNGDLTIGAYGNGQYPFNGNISEVFLYNRALSQTEVSTIYNATKTRYGL